MLGKKISPFLLVGLILLLGSYLRLIDLETIPSGLYVDEASTGFNAYSILRTGKDEYGKDFPLSFRFLGSYTPPLYTYLTSISVHIFGLSLFSVRFVSAISGILMIAVLFIFIKQLGLFKNKLTYLFVTLFFAISPWSIFYSRIGYEINLAFLIFTSGVLFLWLGFKKPWWLILGMGFLSLSTNAYHAQRLLSHLVVVIFLISFRKFFFTKEYLKYLLAGAFVYFLFLIPRFIIFLTPANTARGLWLLYDLTPVSFFRGFLSQYLSYFSPRNLFFQPDSDLQRSLPELSVFYSWMVAPYLVGVYNLIKKISQPEYKIIGILFLLSPIPAALTGDPFSTQRALPLLLPVLLIIGIGLDKLFTGKFNKFVILTAVVLTVFSLLYLYRSYALLFPNERAKTWGYGFEQLAEEIQKRPGEKFVIDTGRIKPAYIELAFYLKTPPEVLQQTVDQNIKKRYYEDISWSSYYNFNNFETRDIDFGIDMCKEQILVGDELAVSDKQAKEHFLNKIFEIKSPDGEIVFQGFKTNPALKCP